MIGLTRRGTLAAALGLALSPLKGLTMRARRGTIDPDATVHDWAARKHGIQTQADLDAAISDIQRFGTQGEANQRVEGDIVVVGKTILQGQMVLGVDTQPVFTYNPNLGAAGSITWNWGNDTGGQFTMVASGAGIAVGVLGSITFGLPRESANFSGILSSHSAAAADANLYITSRSTTGWSIACRNLPAGTLVVTYLIIGQR